MRARTSPPWWQLKPLGIPATTARRVGPLFLVLSPTPPLETASNGPGITGHRQPKA